MADGNEAAPGDEPPAEEASKKYDQDFFLALAAKGKEAWNAWRRSPVNKDVRVAFAGIDFSQAPMDEINFAGFDFGDGVDFSGCRWQRVFFDEANFGHGAKFSRATFGHRVYFRAATFGHFADFSDVTFGDLANFAGASFGNGASFGSGSFDGTSAIFIGARFSSLADFSGATFNPMASFDSTIFQGPVDFSGLPEALFAEKLERSLGPPDEKTAQARKALEARHRSSWKRHGCEPDRFLDISFANARFYGDANFSHRSFEDVANFTNAWFYRPPIFDAAANAARIDFTGAHMGFVPPGALLHFTKYSRDPLRLRALRKLAEDTKNHDLERDLYIEERKAERGVYWHQRLEDLKKGPWKNWPGNARRLIATILWSAVLVLYGALSNYGRSFLRPLGWLILSSPVFYWAYNKILASLAPKAGPLADQYDHAVRMLALGNAVPFVGPLTIDAEIKKFLFCPGFGTCLPIPPEGFQALVIVQNLVSIILVFFIGLALRNYFKIK